MVAFLSVGTCFAAPAFDRDIAPILRTYCSGCHNDREAESGFSVERFATLRKGGDGSGDPIAAGDAAASVLIQRIKSTDSDHMPPDDEPQVPAADLATLEAWITAGAAGPAADASILETLAVPALKAFSGIKPVTSLAVSPDGGRIAVARGRTIDIIAVGDLANPSRRPLLTMTDLPGPIAAVHDSRDGSRLVVAGGITGLRGVAEIRDATTGKLLRSFAGHRDIVYDAELSPDEATLATAGYDRSIKLWNVVDGSLLRSIDVHNGAVFDLAWHPSGKLFGSASADETVKLWRASDGVRLDTLSQPQGEVTSIAFTPDGRHVIAAGRDKRIHLWKLASLDAPAINPPVHARFAHEAPIVAIALSADGRRLVTTAEDRSLKSWSVPGLVLEQDFPRQPDVVAALVPGPDGGFLVGRMDGSLDAIDVARLETASPGNAAVAVQPATTSAPAASPATAAAASPSEQEPNDAAAVAQAVATPVSVSGAIRSAGDTDCFRFTAQAGVPLLLEVIAASGTPKSKLDSRIELLDRDGKPVEQVVLQAVRDSWLTFRGKDSAASGDFRVQNWEEMELDEYLYVGGEVVKLWLYPRGPDSGFAVYPGFGNRHTFFHTSAITHALGEPAWIVQPLPRGATPIPNGLPVFRLPYENDDEPTRRLGTDSQLIFTPPADGEYVARVSDVRGFGGPSDFHYTLGIRRPNPSVTVALEGKDPKVSPGSGRELTFTTTRSEGYDGPVRIEVDNLPAGFTFHGPVEIEAGQQRARGVLSATADAAAPDEMADKAVKVRAVATIGGREVVQDLGTLGDIQLGEKPKVTIEIVAGSDPAVVKQVPGEPLEFTIRPGQTIKAKVRAERREFNERIEFGRDGGADRNLPHGVFIDNLGLNGLLIVEGENEREFFLTAAPKTPSGRRLFHLRTDADGGHASLPAVLNVLPAH
ncbi:MAG: c-type cytochrome domain-containing protein [Planctomycetia bacterium]